MSAEQRAGAARPGYNKGRVPANKGQRYPVEILTPREVAAILDAIPNHTRCGIRNRAMIAVMYRAGLRINETRHLRSKDIDPTNGTIRVLFGKGQKARTVGIDRGGLAFVAAWELERVKYDYPEDAPLFCTSTGRMVSPSYMSETLTRVRQRAGIQKRVHSHGLRHAFAFELAMEGAPLPIIQLQLGHAWATSTAVYIAHIAPKDVAAHIRARTWVLQPSVWPDRIRSDFFQGPLGLSPVEATPRIAPPPTLALVRDDILVLPGSAAAQPGLLAS